MPSGWRVWLRRSLWALLAIAGIGGAVAAYVFRPLPQAAAPSFDALSPSLETGINLAQTGNCAACHTVSGARPYTGGVTFKTDFGTIYSTNITADRKHGIGAWSFADFYGAMKHGERPGGEHLYPAFPYSHFAGLTDNDIASLYLFTRSLAPVAEPNRSNKMQFPFGERRLLYFWKRLYHPLKAAAPSKAMSASWQRGRYLTEAVAHCGACHTPRNLLGGPDTGRHLHGGSYIDQTTLSSNRAWSAVDLTPGKRGLAKWTQAEIIAYLKNGKNRHAVVHGPMTEVWESTRQLTQADAASIASYLKSLNASPADAPMRLPALSHQHGATVYAVHCGTCHLPDGRGDPILGASLRGNPIVQAGDPASLINVILYGPDLPSPPFNTGRSNMKPFGKRLSDEDVAALASFLRGNFGNDATPVSAAEVKAQR